MTFEIVFFCMSVGGCDGKQFEPFSVRTFRAAKLSFELHERTGAQQQFCSDTQN